MFPVSFNFLLSLMVWSVICTFASKNSFLTKESLGLFEFCAFNSNWNRFRQNPTSSSFLPFLISIYYTCSFTFCNGFYVILFVAYQKKIEMEYQIISLTAGEITLRQAFFIFSCLSKCKTLLRVLISREEYHLKNYCLPSANPRPFRRGFSSSFLSKTEFLAFIRQLLAKIKSE